MSPASCQRTAFGCVIWLAIVRTWDWVCINPLLLHMCTRWRFSIWEFSAFTIDPFPYKRAWIVTHFNLVPSETISVSLDMLSLFTPSDWTWRGTGSATVSTPSRTYKCEPLNKRSCCYCVSRRCMWACASTGDCTEIRLYYVSLRLPIYCCHPSREWKVQTKLQHSSLLPLSAFDGWINLSCFCQTLFHVVSFMNHFHIPHLLSYDGRTIPWHLLPCSTHQYWPHAAKTGEKASWYLVQILSSSWVDDFLIKFKLVPAQ